MCAGYCNPWPAHRRDAYVMFTIVGYVRLSVCLSDLSVCMSDAPLQCPSSRPLPALGIEMRDHHWGNVCLFVGLYVCVFACFCHPQHVRCNVHVLPCAGKQGTLPRPHFSIHHCITTVCLSCMGLEETRLAVGVYCGAYCCLRRSARAAYQSLHSSSVHQLPCSLPAFKTWWSAFQKHLWVCSLPAELLHVLQQCLWIYPSNCAMTGKTREHVRVVQREYKTRSCSW